MKAIYSVLLIALFIFIFSCNKSVNSDSKLESKDLELGAPMENNKATSNEVTSTMNIMLPDSTAASSQIILQGASQNPGWDKKIIKTAFLKLEVKDFKLYNDIVHKAAKQYGGYIANEEQNQSEGIIESTISIKVPVAQFEPIMLQLPTTAEKIVEKKITTDDVTGEIVDTKSRLHAKEQMRLKYLEFLKQAKNMEDVLKVQSEINNIQEEMESASGRINYLSHQSSYSTINLTFFQPLAGYKPANDNPGFLTRAAESFKNGFNFIGELFIGFISIWPLILLGLITWVYLKKRAFALTAAKQK